MKKENETKSEVADTSFASIIIGDKVVQVEIPSSLFKTVAEQAPNTSTIKLFTHGAGHVMEILRSIIPSELRPPTARQESYAQSIANTLCVDVPPEALASAISCSEFIERHQGDFQAEKSKQKAKQQIQRAEQVKLGRLRYFLEKMSRKAIAKSEMERGTDINEIAASLGVTPPTVRGYAEDFELYVAESDAGTEQETKLVWIAEYLGGKSAEDIYLANKEEVDCWI